MRFRLFCVFLLLGAVLARPAFAVTDEAESIFGAFGDAIYQVQTIDLATGKKSSIGSGFQITRGGLIATNYHVVSGAVRDPKGTRLEYLRDRDGRGALTILSVDVLHDLAVLRMEKPGKTFLQLGESALPKGTRLFALGNPHDIGFTIIEGTYNGYSHDSFSEKIHFAGSLNPGMSGGPALSHAGRVVGVNVSTAGNQISFLVPVEPLKTLVAEVAARGPSYDFIANADRHISAQLLKGQKRTVDLLLKRKWESVPFGPILVPGRIHEALKCWGVPAHKDNDPYLFYRSICTTQDRTFLGEDFDTGLIGYRYDQIVAKDKMDTARFHAFYEKQYAEEGADNDGREDDVTAFDCHDDFVTAAARVWKASFCVRQYKKYPAVFDMQLFMAMVGAQKDGLIAAFGAQGVSRENALALAKRFIGEIREKPAKKEKTP